jgi:hypothetical protein
MNIKFDENMDKILSALNIIDPARNEIMNGLNTYARDDKIKILDSIDNHLHNLVTADNNLNNLISNGGTLAPYKNLITDEWNNMIKQLAELQGLIILKKVKKNDCDGVIKQLLIAITGKITVVNDIIKSELGSNNQAGGNNNLIYKSKYLKYKTKYLNLIENKKYKY